MPLFEYRCGRCAKEFEAYKRPSEVAAGERCPACGGEAEKLEISLVGAAGPGGARKGTSVSCGGGGGVGSPFR